MTFFEVQKLDQSKLTDFTLTLNQHNSLQKCQQENSNLNQHKQNFCNLEVKNAPHQHRNQQET